MREYMRCYYYRNKIQIKIIVQEESETTIKHLSYKENKNLTYQIFWHFKDSSWKMSNSKAFKQYVIDELSAWTFKEFGKR